MSQNFVIPIWLKFRKDSTNSVERGERIFVNIEKRSGMKHCQISIVRQFFSYPDWEDSSVVSFSVNRHVIREIMAVLEKVEEDL
ncbi:MAG: hypothetical protein A2047_00960 [Omnitrophica bacterium GWA2_41_15]|nr:MAG: hypothetical protein A2047_00960 [Omnitrophica bacterium GWA2_41_15]